MRGEGDIAGPLAELAADFPDLSIGSYPFQKDGRLRIEYRDQGQRRRARVDAAMARLAASLPCMTRRSHL